jgi:hypothetical protein
MTTSSEVISHRCQLGSGMCKNHPTMHKRGNDADENRIFNLYTSFSSLFLISLITFLFYFASSVCVCICVCVHTKTIKLGNDPKTVAMAAATTTIKNNNNCILWIYTSNKNNDTEGCRWTQTFVDDATVWAAQHKRRDAEDMTKVWQQLPILISISFRPSSRVADKQRCKSSREIVPYQQG